MSELLISSEETPVEEKHRNFTGWICFALLVGFILITTGASMSKAKPDRLGDLETEELLLKQVLSAESLEKTFAGPLGGSPASNHDALAKTMDDSISGLAIASDKDLHAEMLYAAMRTYQKESVPPEHLKLLETSKLKADQAFYQIYTAAKLTQSQANELIRQLPAEPFVYQAARVQALEKAGDKDAVMRFVSPYACLGTVLITLASWPFIFASLAVWTIFRRKLRDGTMAPKGIPMETITELDADRLGIRAAQILAIFVLSGVLVMFAAIKLNLHINEVEATAFGGVLTILCIYWLQRIPVEGKRISLSMLGLNRENLGKNIWLGCLGFLAEFPVAMFLGEMSVSLMRGLPKPTHPAEALEHTHDLRTVIPILIFACLIAPFWEEIAFRGLLFPGLKRLMGGLLPGILLSSLIFASIHPQGISEWLPLAFIGATSCYLSYQSRSLIPGMVMHGLHNAVLCVLMLLT